MYASYSYICSYVLTYVSIVLLHKRTFNVKSDYIITLNKVSLKILLFRVVGIFAMFAPISLIKYLRPISWSCNYDPALSPLTKLPTIVRVSSPASTGARIINIHYRVAHSILQLNGSLRWIGYVVRGICDTTAHSFLITRLNYHRLSKFDVCALALCADTVPVLQRYG